MKFQEALMSLATLEKSWPAVQELFDRQNLERLLKSWNAVEHAIPDPSVFPSPDGEVCFEWFFFDHWSITLDIDIQSKDLGAYFHAYHIPSDDLFKEDRFKLASTEEVVRLEEYFEAIYEHILGPEDDN